MGVPKIEQLDVLISEYVGKNQTIVDSKITRLTEPGENFGSEMLKVDLVLKSQETGKIEDVNIVAKLLPESEFFKNIFNVQVTFITEKAFYDTIVPTLQKFQKKQGEQNVIDFFPKYFGSRKNLKNDGNLPVDDDAALLLENLKVKGFANVDRFIGFDLPTAKLILKNLAEFHAVPIALKQKEPKIFETKVKPFLACFNPNEDHSPPPPFDLIEKLLEHRPNFIPKVQKSMKNFGKARNTFKEPFATISHRDLWVNNIMIKYSGNSAIDCKFVDFQSYTYDSPAADILFFLFTSVELGVLQENLDELLKLYHKEFVKTLKTLNCNLSFTYEEFLHEITYSSEFELAHITFMSLVVIFAKKGNHPQPDKTGGPPDLSNIVFDEGTVKRIVWFIEEWDKRGWLNF